MSLMISLGSNTLNTSKVLEIYDENTKSWTRANDLSIARRNYMVEVVNNKLILIGGTLAPRSDHDPLTLVDSLDVSTGIITPVAPMIVPRQYSATAVVGEGENALLYVFGGWGISQRLDSVERWSPVTNTWTLLTPMPHTNTGCRATVLNGNLYVLGGRLDDKYLREMWLYNTTTNTWESKAPMLFTNGYFGVTSHKNYIYTAGGNRTTLVPMNAVERYDSDTDSWTLLAHITAFGLVALTVFNDKVVCAGGDLSSSVQEYDEENNTWVHLSPLHVARAASSLVTIPAPV